MPEINNNPNKPINLKGLDINNANIIKEEKPAELPIEKQAEIDLTNDPKSVTGRSLVHSAKSKDAKALKERVDIYTEEFLKDTSKAAFLMDSVDTFKEAGFTLEEATEAAIKMARSIGDEKINLIKDIDGIGQYVADVCTSFMEKFDWDLDKSIAATAQAMNTIFEKH